MLIISQRVKISYLHYRRGLCLRVHAATVQKIYGAVNVLAVAYEKQDVPGLHQHGRGGHPVDLPGAFNPDDGGPGFFLRFKSLSVFCSATEPSLIR